MNSEYISLGEATALFPARKGKPITVATLRYRIKKGCRGVRLEGFLSGGAWFTTKDAVDRFHAALNSRAMSNAAPPRRQSSKAARDYLKGIGIDGKGKKKNRTRKETAR